MTSVMMIKSFVMIQSSRSHTRSQLIVCYVFGASVCYARRLAV